MTKEELKSRLNANKSDFDIMDDFTYRKYMAGKLKRLEQGLETIVAILAKDIV